MTKRTFGLVQKGSGRFGKKKYSQAKPYHQRLTGSSSSKSKAAAVPLGDSGYRREDLKAKNDIDSIMGFDGYTEGPERLGWLVNMHPTVVYETETDAGKSGLDLYFIGEEGDTFKATVLFQPYFFVICKVFITSNG
jgi:DNA polymerase epsilon subunit 1